MLECGQVARLKPKVDCAVCQELGHMVRHLAKATTFCRSFLPLRYIRSNISANPRRPPGVFGGVGVFLIDVTSEPVIDVTYEHFGSTNLRDLYPTL
jgi:hypothetical protein